MRTLRTITTVLLLFISPIISTAQLSEEHRKQIDQLFLDWDRPNHPGGAAGIMQDGKVIYAKGFGLASLEYKVPNTYGTLFNIASVSKQFTSMGILLLEQEGKLSVDDDIRKHLPELPDFGEKITLRHCMYHTSGMRSLHALLGMAGWRGDDARSNEDLLQLMKRQKELNFSPGTDYLYCNTGYMLLATIIEKISGQDFASWMKTHVFEPLDMNHTYVEDDYSRVVTNNATSYYGRRVGNFSRAVEYWGYVGSGNIHATVEDLLTWQSNFISPSKGWEKAFEKMQSVGTLANGKSIGYGFGISINQYKGKNMIGHGGSIGGFRSYSVSFPDLKTSIVVLSNYSAGNPQGKAFSSLDILRGKQGEVSESNTNPLQIKAISLAPNKMKKFEGNYWNLNENYSRKIYLKDDTLIYSRGEDNETRLIPVAENKFQMAGLDFEATVTFEPDAKGDMAMIFRQKNENVEEQFESYEKPEIDSEFLDELAGVYVSPEIDTQYTLRREADKLMGYHVRHGDFALEIKRDNFLEADLWVFSSIKVKRDKKGNVLGIHVSNGRVRNLWFEKR